MFVRKIFTGLQRQKARPSQIDTTDKHVINGNNDAFPLELAHLVENSPSASSCINTVSDFIEGDGFSDESLAEIKVNKQGDTFGDLHSAVSDSLAMHWGVFILVKYNANGDKVGLYHLPFENCRFGRPDDKGIISKIHVNPFYGTNEYSNRRGETEIYDVFNDDKQVIAAQMAEQGSKYKGQIFFWGKTTALSRFYPKPRYYSAKKWMGVDYRISEYHDENLRDGLLNPVVFKIKGDPNQPSTNPIYADVDEKDRPTKSAEFDEYISENFSGTDRVGNILVFWGNEDELPEIIPFPTNANGDLFNTLQSTTIKQITIATNVPAILANISEGVSLGGDGNTIRAAVKLMQQRSKKWKNKLESIYKKLLNGFVYSEVPTLDFTILDYNPYPETETIDKQIWDSLNQATKENWISKNTKIEIINTPTPTTQAPPAAAPATTNALKVMNVSFDSYPEGAVASAKRAIKWMNDTGVKCGGKPGKDISMAISERKPITYKTVKRINNFLKKNSIHMNKPFSEGCEPVLFHSWGGKDMMMWCESKVNEIG